MRQQIEEATEILNTVMEELVSCKCIIIETLMSKFYNYMQRTYVHWWYAWFLDNGIRAITQ